MGKMRSIEIWNTVCGDLIIEAVFGRGGGGEGLRRLTVSLNAFYKQIYACIMLTFKKGA